jgi:glycosyltransferase involved in cell wall biosynthesis
MRIGLDVTPLCVPQSGVGTYTTSLLDHLARYPDDEIVPLTHRPWYLNATPQAGGPRLALNKTAWMQLVLPGELRRKRIDVCHFTNYVAPLRMPCPSVVTIHDMTLWLYPEYHGRKRLLAMRSLIPLVARRASAIVTISESAKRDIIEILRVPEQKVHVIYEAPAGHFRPLADRPALELVRRDHDLPERFILHVGTLEPRKNLVRLLEAFALVRQRGAERCALVLVGQRGWKDEAIFAAAERLALGDDVRFLGYVSPETLVALYNLATVAAFPSLYEGFGLPVVESMSCGTPVVTTTRGSLGEVAGDAAEFVDPSDVESIAEGLWRVLDSPAHQDELREKGFRRAGSFSWAEAAAQTRGVYTRVLGRQEQAHELRASRPPLPATDDRPGTARA